MQKVLTLLFISTLPMTSLHPQVQKPDYVLSTGFFVLDGKIYNADGTEFIMRGLNQNHFWGDESFNLKSIEGIASTPSNCVRVVMSDQDWVSQSNTPAKKRLLVEKYIAKGIVPMVELHDGTCEDDPSYIERMVDSWTLPANVAWLNEHEKYVLLNIANEWGPGDTDADWRVWRDTYRQAIADIRAAGINNLIVIDSPKCGQGPRAMQVYGQEVLDDDPQHNIVFSIHMYGWWRSATRAAEVSAPNSNNPPWLAEWELQTMLDLGLPVIVGEFSWTEASSVSYDTEEIIAFCQQKGIGWLAWSWNGNSDPVLNMTDGWKYDSDADLKPFGNLIVNHPFYGLRATADRATVFGAPNQRPNCRITVPADQHEIDADAPLSIIAEADDMDGVIRKVVFYADDDILGERETAPFSITWERVPRGLYSITAVAWDDQGLTTASVPLTVRVGFRQLSREALFVVGNVDLRPGDALIKQRLEMLGYNVEVLEDDNAHPTRADGKEIVLISSSIAPTRVKTAFADVAVPVIVSESQLFDDMRMATGSINIDYGRVDATSITIINSSHPMAGELAGTSTVYKREADVAWATPPAGAEIIAALNDNPRAAVLFLFEKGAQMVEARAPAARVGLFVQDNSSEWLTADGWRLFDAAVDYAQQSSVSVDQEIAAQPVIFDLKQNFPNPFNPSTNIEFQSALDTSVKIEIYNVYGQLVNTLLDGEKKTGVHSVTWRGVDQNGESLASGIYYYRMTAQNGDEMFTMTRKMMLLR